MRLPIVHHPAYTADIPASHRFPMLKFKGVADCLRSKGLLDGTNEFQPEPASKEDLLRAHSPSYVDQVLAADVPELIAREIGFPMTQSVGFRGRCATGGTIMTGRLALVYGMACNTAGGSHHARYEHGAGFCVFNDVAVAIRTLQAEGLIERALVIDLDVHQGDGTAQIFEHDPTVFTLSIHAQKNYPVRKVPSTFDIGLPDKTGDEAYMKELGLTLPLVLERARADIVFYNAGVDLHKDDKLGRLSLTDEGLARRDAYVISLVRRHGLPLAGVLGGGYDEDIDRLSERHTILHQTAMQYMQTREDDRVSPL
ncbi:histone deacetylase [Rhodobacteraceae bacterium RKSG542]|uniref:histone deacetylase family protein n=1 Tax=Pseudovibrio flavus TaxID=2529854 RepID=UPI0012BCE486|nr:histone deacetylase [Pseudovibrio flavus]MTI18798.1 histone deacetylase [Pseudovibrio flavus]